MATVGTLGEKHDSNSIWSVFSIQYESQLDQTLAKTANMFQTPTSIIAFTTTKPNVTIMQMLG
jgi:hypothetical protein